MSFLQLAGKNLIRATHNGANFIQLMFVSILIWWVVGGFLDIKFIIPYLNYLVEFPWNILVAFTMVLGIIGICLDRYIVNLIFSLLNIFLFGSVALAFWTHSVSMSGGTYTVLLIVSLLLLNRIQEKKKIQTEIQLSNDKLS